MPSRAFSVGVAPRNRCKGRANASRSGSRERPSRPHCYVGGCYVSVVGRVPPQSGVDDTPCALDAPNAFKSLALAMS